MGLLRLLSIILLHEFSLIIRQSPLLGSLGVSLALNVAGVEFVYFTRGVENKIELMNQVEPSRFGSSLDWYKRTIVLNQNQF